MLDILCKRNKCRYGIPRSPDKGSAMLCGLLLLLFATETLGGCTNPCPNGCTCSDITKKYCSVNCSGAGLTGIPIQSEVPNSGSNIRVLYLDNNNITSIGANELNYMTNLEELFLQGNMLSSIDKDAFDLNNLIIINLSNNPITALRSDLFRQQAKVETLNLSQTGLSALPNFVFDQIRCLKILDLSYNNFQSLQKEIFNSLICLETLNLRGNNFQDTGSLELPSARFTSLKELDISHNLFSTFQTQVLTSLNLKQLNIANNPFLCNCDLLSFRNELVTLETSNGVEFIDRNAVNCSNAPSVNLLDMSSEKFWCPEKLGSCYYDAEEKTKLDVLFTVSTPTPDNQTCIQFCFDSRSSYGIFDNGLCICGNTDPSYGCWCASKVYAEGGNMACLVPGTSTPVVYVEGVYQVSAGLTVEPFGVLTAGQTNSFKALVTLPTIVIYHWDFGDTSDIYKGTSSAGLAYNAPHTYHVPGTYTMTVSACTANNTCTSISVPVEVRPSLSTDSLDIECPTTPPSLSSTVTVTGTLNAGYNTEITWTKLPTDNVTATTVGECNSGWDFFRGRCLQNLPSSYQFLAATSTCNGGQLLTIHYPEEIPDVLNKYSSLATIYLGAQKSGSGYVWTNGNQAYFMVGDVTDASIGECVVIDRSTGALKGVVCSSTHSILCQQEIGIPVQGNAIDLGNKMAPNTECASGGHYYMDNGHCYTLMTTLTDWPNAASQCTSVYTNAELAVIDSAALQTFVVSNVFGSVTQAAWTGLTDRNSEAYLMWTNNQSTINYNPIGSAPETDCFTLDSTGAWLAQSCKETNYFICQYSLREKVKVPSYLVGVGHFEPLGTVYSLSSVSQTTLPAAAASIINMFPGLWFSHQGEIQQWNFKTNVVDKDTLLIFQVYTPVCSSGTLIKPGCDGNGGRFASCSSTVSGCSAAPYCNEGSEVCHYTNACIDVADPCNCNTLNASFCSTPFAGDPPTYRLVGQTPVHLPAGPVGYYSVNANGIKVNEGDIIAFQINNTKEVITTSTTDIPNLQNVLQKVTFSWVSPGDELDMASSPSPWRNNTAFYFQAVYTIPQTVTMPQSLQYSTVAGAYTYQLSLPNDNLSKTCSITVEEAVGELVWIYPAIHTTIAGTDTFYIDANVKTYLVFAVKRGTNLQVSWEVNGAKSTTSLQSSCPSSVSSVSSTLCDNNEYRISQPFSFMEYTFPYNNGNPISININVTNSVGSGTKTVACMAFLPLDITFNLTDFSHGYLAEINQAVSFTTTIVSGNPTSYVYSVNGTVHSTSTSPVFTYTFTVKDVYEVTVEISDGYKTTNSSVIVSSRFAADVQNLAITGVPSVVSIGSAVNFSITCNVNNNANVMLQWEFESGTQTDSFETTTTSLSLTKSHSHSINGTYTFRIVITDDFSHVAAQTQSVRVVESLPPVLLSATQSQVKTGESINFIATVPNVATKDYGTLTYGFDYKDGTVDTGALNERSHVFTSAGVYEVKVNVTNGADTIENTVTVEVFEEISGLSITADNIVLVNSTATITASVVTGNSLNYRFEISDNSLSSGNTTNNVYKPYLDKNGHFNITVTAWNILSTVTVTKEIYVVDTSTFYIIGFTHEKYTAAGSPFSVTVNVLYYDLSDLVVTWTFDGNLLKGSGSFTQSYTFNTAGTYNINVTVQAKSTTNFISGYSTVEVQQPVSGATLTSNSPVGLTTGGSATITFTATVSSGDNLRYTWDYDGTVTMTTTNTFSTTTTREVNGTMVVMVWNDVTHQNATASYQVQHYIDGVQITCLNCSTQNSNSYLQVSTPATFIASITSGSDVTYNWDFGDSSTGVGISQTHSYSSGATYTIVLTASNNVGPKSATFNVTVQELVTSVTISCLDTIKFVNSSFSLQATAVGGTDLSYTWQDCVTCPQIFHNSVNYTTGVYNTSGFFVVIVKAYNLFSDATRSYNVVVLDYITTASIDSNLIQGKYAAQNTQYTFAASSNTMHPDTYYEWKILDGSTVVFSTPATNLKKNITHSFTSAVVYEVSVRVWNILRSEFTTKINVTVEAEIAGAGITFDKTSPIGTDEDLVITAVVTQGTQLNYKWSIQNNTGIYLLPTTAKSFNYSFSIKGTYSFVLEISNSLGGVNVTKAITVIESVTGVGISSGVNESYPFIATGTSISFTSVYLTGDSVSTSWSVADGISSALTFNGPSFSHMFSSSGAYTVTVTITNVVNSGTHTLAIYVEGAISSLSVLPDRSLAQTGQLINIAANYNSGADNLVFEWTVDGNMQNLTVDSISHVFNNAGTFTVSLNAYNHISKMADQVVIVVEVAIMGLSMTNCNVTHQVNNQVSSTLSVVQGTDVTYSYSLQTGTTAVTGTGNSIAHTFTQTGIYSLFVNASNQVSSESIQCIYTIIGPISGVAVDTSNSDFFVGYTVNFQVTGINLIGVTYNWTFLAINDDHSTQNSLLSKVFTTAGTYQYQLVVYNVISTETITGTFVIEALHCSAMQVTKGGQENKIRKKSSSSTFEVTVDKNGCTHYTTSYEWKVFNGNCGNTLGSTVTLSSNTVINTPKLILDQSLDIGQFCVQLTTKYDSTPLSNSIAYNLTIQNSDLVALISGGSKMKFPGTSPISVNGSLSFDPDSTTTVLSYSWACTVSYPLTTPPGHTDACNGVIGSSSSSVVLSPGNLLAGQTYTITLTVSASGRTSGTFQQEIEISSNDDPVPIIKCVNCQSTGSYVINEGQHIALTGECYNCAATDTKYYEWSVFTLDASSNRVQLSITSAMTSTGINSENFVLLAGHLPETHAQYIFKLEISKTSAVVTLQSSTELILNANSKPSGGSCSLVTSGSIEPLTTPVGISCSGYTDPDSSSGELNYKVVSHSKDPATLGENVVMYYGTLQSPNFYVAPWPGTVRNAVNIKVYVVDENGAEKLSLDTDVSISSTVTNGNQLPFLQTQTTSNLVDLVSNNNPTKLLQYGIAFIHEMNELSRQESLAVNSASHVDDRNKLRNVITVAVLFLPLETIYQQQQMAHILNLLTHYPGEYQTSSCQTLVLNQIDILKKDLEQSAFQGADKNEFTSGLLLNAVSNSMDAVNAAVYSSVNISNVTSLDTTTLSLYKPSISTLSVPTSTSSEDHKREIITRAFTFGDEIVILNLKTLLPLEDPVVMTLDSIKVYGRRTWTDSIEQSYISDGCVAVFHPDMLSTMYPTRQEVFQILMVIPQNPFTWGMVGDVQLTTKVIAAGFTDPSGTEVSVNGIPEGRRPKFLIMKDGGLQYNLTNSITNSTNYDPESGLTFSSTIIQKSSVKKIIVDTSNGYDGAALHLMLKFTVVPNPAVTANATCVINAYLGKNYEATSSSYEKKKEIRLEHMQAGHDHRDYTIFVDYSDFDTDSSYSVTVYNNDPNFDVNISAANYYSTCQFFDTTTSTWSTNGCSPTDESIENYAVCECHHLTPFGGGMLAPPDTLSFSDLLNLDLATNPVVFVTCSLIFVVYVVAVIICRRLDQSSLERISSIPLCGKDGSFKYEVTVITGRQIGAGTTANVGMKIYGEYGKSSSKQLDKKWAFQRNGQDTFIMAHDTNLGNIEKIMIWHDNSGLDPSWYLVQVIVKDLQTDVKYYFFANFWMSLEMEKGFIQKELTAAGSSEIQRFGRMFNRALSNCMADRHLWYSVMDRPALSRFTRVQRATCVVTILYTFMAINAMWYGLLKQENSGAVSSFGWEEVVLAFITNVMAFPFTLIIIWLFKRSKSQINIFDHGPRIGTAQTIEIDYEGPAAGSFKTNDDEFLSYLDRESTTDSLVQASMTHTNLRRSRTLKITRQATDDSLSKAVNSFDSGIGMSQEGKLKRTNNPHLWSKTGGSQKDETYITKTEGGNTKVDRKEEVKEAADGILQYLDDIESECMTKEQSVIQKRRSLSRRTGTKKTDWKEVEDILHSDTESRSSSKSRPLRKKASTSTIGSYGNPTSSQSIKGYSPREDPNINGHDRKLPSAGSTIIWAKNLRNTQSMDSTGLAEGIGPLEPDLGLAQQSNPALEREEMLLLERRNESKSCTLPAWFVYVAYVICFLLCVTSVILVILYGQKFGADVALQWILALLFCVVMSFIVIEPLKALVMAFYASSVLKKEDTIEEDAIDIMPTVDTSNEKVKESKFTPLAGFALLNAREEGQKILRMRLMLRQFIAYVFYLWLIMTLCYVNFNHDSYMFKSSVNNVMLQTTIPNMEKSFVNISNVDEFWSWTQSALVTGLHHRELFTDLEFGTLLGVARMRLVRSVEDSCPATEHPMISGLESLTNRTCWGNFGYNEDKTNYGEQWNYSQNLSWRHYDSSETGSKTRYGYVYTYGGGGYVQELGSTYNDTLDKLKELQTKNWIDERTRAIFIDFTLYSAANELTTVVNLMIEFPLTGGLNTSSDIQSQVLLRFVQNVVDPLMVCQCILFLVNIYLVCHIVNAIRIQPKVHLSDPWNWFEILTTLMAVLINGLYIGCVVEASSTFNDYFNNKYGFTNFEAISDTHVAMRYVQGILIFLLMFKVVKQLRFIKFLYIYERTLSDAFGRLAGVAVIFVILFCSFGMAAYLWYGRSVDGFETYWHTLTSLVGMFHGHFSFWTLMESDRVFTHFFLYSYYAFCYGITIALILAVLRDSYRTAKGQMYFKATMDMQDYEMIEFMMKRFKLWAGIDKPKQGIRRVHFDRRMFSASSRGSRPSSRDSMLSYDPFETNPRTTRHAAERLDLTWEDCLCTLERVCGLDEKEDEIIKSTQKGIDEWKFQTRIKNYEKELQGTGERPPKGAPSGTHAVPRVSKIPRRTSTTGCEAGNSKRGLGTPDARTSSLRGRPLSDQGGRAPPEPKRSNSRERFSIYNFFKSVNPSKDAWK